MIWTESSLKWIVTLIMHNSLYPPDCRQTVFCSVTTRPYLTHNQIFTTAPVTAKLTLSVFRLHFYTDVSEFASSICIFWYVDLKILFFLLIVFPVVKYFDGYLHAAESDFVLWKGQVNAALLCFLGPGPVRWDEVSAARCNVLRRNSREPPLHASKNPGSNRSNQHLSSCSPHEVSGIERSFMTSWLDLHDQNISE